MLVNAPDLNMDSCFLPMHSPFFLPYSVEPNLTLTLAVSLHSSFSLREESSVI